jgi:integrase
LSANTYATLAQRWGVGTQVVSQRLSHANLVITWDTYAHVPPDDDQHAAALFHRHLYGGGA